MKMLLVGLLLIGCGIDDEEKTEKVEKSDTERTSASDDLATKYQGKAIHSSSTCMLTNMPEVSDLPYCSYTRNTENSDCGKKGNYCSIMIIARGLTGPEHDKYQKIQESITKDPDKDVWPLTYWTANCLCSEEKITTTNGQDDSDETKYQCEDGKCSLEELQKGVLSKATRNYKATSDDNKLSELEVDLLKDMVKDAVANLPQEPFRNYFKPATE